MSDCHHEIICMDFVNDGAELCVACDGGHLFVINLTIEVERLFDLYYLKQNKFCLNKDENAIFDNSFLPARILTVSLSDKLGLEKF